MRFGWVYIPGGSRFYHDIYFGRRIFVHYCKTKETFSGCGALPCNFMCLHLFRSRRLSFSSVRASRCRPWSKIKNAVSRICPLSSFIDLKSVNSTPLIDYCKQRCPSVFVFPFSTRQRSNIPRNFTLRTPSQERKEKNRKETKWYVAKKGSDMNGLTSKC